MKTTGVRFAFLAMFAAIIAACSSPSQTVLPQSRNGTDIRPTQNTRYSREFPGILTAGPMPTPLSPKGQATYRGGKRSLIDIPGNVEVEPMAISAGALSGQVHTVPSLAWQASPAPQPTIRPCTSACRCAYTSAPRSSMLICPLEHAGVPSTTRAPANTVITPDQGGQAGYSLPAGSGAGVGDIYVAMSASNSIVMNTPASGGYNQLYAPTTHGPNGNCIEVSTNYFNGYNTIGTTVAEMQIWDFCTQNGWAGAVPMDANFFNKYVRVYTNGNGLPQYILEVAQGTDSRWHTYVYNNNNGYWDDVYDSAPGVTTNVLGGEGWSIFETHYESAGQSCSNAGTIGESGLRLHYSNVSHQDWNYASTDSGYTYGYWGQCFSGNGTTTPYYSFAASPASDMSWTVTTH